MTSASEVSRHYTRGDLRTAGGAARSTARPTFEALAPYDHFHGRGLEATEEMADLLKVSAATMCSMSAAAEVRRATWPGALAAA